MPLRVMLVDDEYLIRNLIRMKLDWSAYGMEITAEAGGGAEALALVGQARPDIIFTDISMPDMNGLEFSRMVSEKHPGIKIVVITGHDDFEYARRGLQLGVIDYLLKPIKTDELKAVAEKLAGIIEEERVREQGYLRMLGFLEADRAEADPENMAEKPDSIVARAKAYISEHMAEEDLRLATVAEGLFISAGHLGRLLKKDTGRSFVEYLTDTRIKRATELLRSTSLKGYEVGVRVGIHDPHYFSILFKKATGMSINEFRGREVLQ
jgi:YesN/AraC family two-component response regulator